MSYNPLVKIIFHKQYYNQNNCSKFLISQSFYCPFNIVLIIKKLYFLILYILINF